MADHHSSVKALLQSVGKFGTIWGGGNTEIVVSVK